MSVEEDAASLLRTFAACIVQAHVRGFQQRTRYLRQVNAPHRPRLGDGEVNNLLIVYRKTPSGAFNVAGGITASTYGTSTKPLSGYRRPGAIVVDTSFTCSTET